MFDTLTDRLNGAFKVIRGDNKLNAEHIEEAIREVRRALLEADVSLKVVKLLISGVRQRALGADVIDSVTPEQQFIKIVHDELVTVLGGENVGIDTKENTDGGPAVLMLLGLQGSGKTTACAKLALKLKNEGNKPLLVACDIQRPAAIEQLKTLGAQIDVPVYSQESGADVFDISKAAIALARQENLNPVILDTAGRLQIDTDLMAEVLLLERAFKPKEKLLVIDAMTGQESVNVAETFNTQLDVTGIILTKIDGDARGGAALSVREAVGKPIKFIGTGEKLQALEAFYPDRIASRILGMGDVISLVEKAQQAIDEKEAEKVAKQMMQGEFTLEMFIKTQSMVKKMGSMGDIMKMMGVGGMLGINSSQQEQIATQGETIFKAYETAYNSMTKEERIKPQMIDMSRRRRIAKGSGLQENQLGKMLNEFEQMRSMFKQFSKLLGGFGGMAGAGAGGLGGLFGGGSGMGNNMSPESLAELDTPANRLKAQQMAKQMGMQNPGSKRPSAKIPGLPFGGPGGGYYKKKKK
jgi:signal recognition particle subunit SRP54